MIIFGRELRASLITIMPKQTSLNIVKKILHWLSSDHPAKLTIWISNYTSCDTPTGWPILPLEYSPNWKCAQRREMVRPLPPALSGWKPFLIVTLQSWPKSSVDVLRITLKFSYQPEFGLFIEKVSNYMEVCRQAVREYGLGMKSSLILCL